MNLIKKVKFIPVTVIVFIWILFSLPFLTSQKVPFPSQYLGSYFSPWSAYSEYFGPVKNGAMPDIIGQIYPWKTFTVETYKSGVIPLWNPYSFGGTPHLANYQSAVLSPMNIGFFMLPFIEWWSILVLLQPLLAGLFMYAFARSIRQGSFGALVASISFMFCGFITCWMGYATLGYAILFLPLALFAIQKYFETKSSRYFALLSATIPLSFFSGHFQVSLYFLIFTFAFLIYKAVSTKDLKTSLYLFIASALGIFICAPQLFPTIELYGQSFRSTIVQKIEVIPWGYLPTLLAPDYFGNPVTGNKWFGSYAEWNGYIGLVGLFLAIYSFKNIKKGIILFFFLSAGFSLLFAFESPLLNSLVLLKIPVLSTSALSRVIVLFSFSMAILAGFGMDRIVLDVKQRKYKGVFTLLGVFVVIFGLLWVAAVFKLFMSPEHALIAKSNLKFPSIIFATFCLVFTVGYFLKAKKISLVLCALLILILSFDMFRFSTKWMPFDPKSLVYPNAPVTSFYPNIQGSDRVFGNYGAEGSVYYKLPAAEGYDAVYIRRYGQFIASLDKGTLIDSFRSVVAYPKTGKYTLLGMDLLGGRYIVHKVSDGQNVWEFPFWKYPLDTINLIYDDQKYQILENTNAFPRAFLVDKVIVESNPQQILNTMFSPKTNLRNTAVVEQNINASNLSSGSAEIIRYTPNNISITTVSKGPSFLVLTDTYYPGWQATIDGNKREILRSDFAFRGVLLPKGTHTVEFNYEPASFRYGVYVAIIGLIGMLIIIMIAARDKTVRPKK